MSYPSDIEYPRRVVVDDTDPRINYVGTWSLDVGSFDNEGIFGAPYNHTMHGTNENRASFSFTFEGEFVQVRGAKENHRINRPQNVTSDNTTALAKWTCQVDGSSIKTTPYRTFMYDMTNNMLCEQSRLSRGPHTLTLNVTIDDPNSQIWWLDKIEYTPLPTANLANEVLKIDGSDPSVQYDNGTGNWLSIAGLFNGTGTTGASMSLQFNGTSVSLYGFNEGSDRDWTAGSGRYFVDSSGDTNFEVPASKPLPFTTNNRTDWYHQLMLTTPKLSPGSHEMVIAYTGVQKSDPVQWLSIDYFYVTASEGGAQLNSTSTTAGGLPERTGGSDNKKSTAGPIAGGVIGGVAGLALIALAAFFLWRRKAKQDRYEETKYDSIPFNPDNMYAAPNAVGGSVHSFTPQRYVTSPTNSVPPSGMASAIPTMSTFSTSHPPSSSFHDTYRDSTSQYGSSSGQNTAGPIPFDPNGPLRPNRFSVANPNPTYSDNYTDGGAALSGVASISSHSSTASPNIHNQAFSGTKRPDGETASQSTEIVERRHQDSGVRYPPQHQVVVDLPPDYTPD
ncbi:hypothetical protein V5O48_007885 [Marasmius crinis-equi]|uniref:Epidermal growth factor receptor-like transmembrane-juxtamembrane segment domain-containing protein n=1 Tax=Marasmius crinis-equi TaxID=585013 RepID=A0ABR3FFL8_9AGAR